jgi:hypothetical protein
MKFIITSLLSIFALASFSQVVNSDYQKLFDLYIMDKHEDCLDKSLSFIEKDDHRRSPEPYIFASRAILKLYPMAETHDEEEDLIKDGLKYGAKYVKYKNKLDNPEDFDVFYKEDEEALIAAGLEMAKYYYYESKLRKSAYYVRKVYKIGGEDPSTELLAGLAYLINRNHRQGINLVKNGINHYEKADTPAHSYDEIENELIVNFLKAYRPVAKSLKKSQEYNDLLTQIHQLLPVEYAAQLKEIQPLAENTTG